MSGSPADPSLSPREFCRLQQQLIGRLAMRKKRKVAMEPVQELKAKLLTWLEERDPSAEGFRAAIQEAVVAISPGDATGPAQAVASDLVMDWEMACSSPAYAVWLRSTASPPAGASGA